LLAAEPRNPARSPLLRKRHIQRGLTMNRNVTIGLGTLIVIIIIVALLF
jgi:hypothetical protein